MPFDSDKAVQAAAALLRTEEVRQMSYLRLLKLLYIADRESLKDTGRTITGDHVVAMPHGPVLNSVYNLICGAHYETPKWSRHFQKAGYQLKLLADPGVGCLSRYELKKLAEVAHRYADKGDFDLAELTHEFDEWKRNWKEETVNAIPLKDIIEAVGRGEDVKEIIREDEEQAAFVRIFGK